MRRLVVLFAVAAIALALAPPAGASGPSHEKYPYVWGPWTFAPGEWCDSEVQFYGEGSVNLIWWGDVENPDKRIYHDQNTTWLTNTATGASISSDSHYSDMKNFGPWD